MNDQKSVKEWMDAYGYVFQGSCHCDGYETWRYKKDHREVRWRKYKYQFRILEGRTVAVDWTSVLQLAEKLKKIHGDVAVSK